MGKWFTLQQILEDIAKNYQLSHETVKTLVRQVLDILEHYVDGDGQDGEK